MSDPEVPLLDVARVLLEDIEYYRKHNYYQEPFDYDDVKIARICEEFLKVKKRYIELVTALLDARAFIHSHTEEWYRRGIELLYNIDEALRTTK